MKRVRQRQISGNLKQVGQNLLGTQKDSNEGNLGPNGAFSARNKGQIQNLKFGPGKTIRLTWKEKDKWIASPKKDEGFTSSPGRGLGFNPIRGENLGIKTTLNASLEEKREGKKNRRGEKVRVRGRGKGSGREGLRRNKDTRETK